MRPVAFVTTVSLSMLLSACGGGAGGGGETQSLARITEYGLYARGTDIVRPDPNSPSGQSRGTVGYRLLETTQQVPLVLGTSFGICFELPEFVGGVAPAIVVQVTHPQFSRPGAVPSSYFEVRPSMYRYAGMQWTCLGYGFDHAFELVPGMWRFAVAVNGNVQASQEFTAR